MSKRKSTDPDAIAIDPDRDDFAAGRPLSRKQVTDMIRKKESFVDADFRGCDLNGIAFDGCDLTNAKFGESNLSKCSFRSANLTGASFWNASLKDASLEDANLEEADFDYANLDGVTFRGAKIRKAIFPLKRLPLDSIKTSVRTGERVKMEAQPHEDED